MFFAVPCEQYNVDPVTAQALNLLFILHADREQNASTRRYVSQVARARIRTPAISSRVSAL